MTHELFIYLLYLFYGLAFFTIGVAIISKDTGASKLEIARILWLLALFAFTHALHEWIELYLIPHPHHVSDQVFPIVETAKLVLVLVSFGFMFQFGVRMMQINYPEKRFLIQLLLPMFLVLFAISIILHGIGAEPEYFEFTNQRLRNFIGLPGALLSGSGFIFYSHSIRDKNRQGAINFALAGACLILYGVLTGLIPSRTIILGVWVEFLRGGTAFVILHFMMNALRIFDIEQQEIMEDRLQRFARSEKLTAMGKLAAGIAHEINNPLTNVALNVNLLETAIADQRTDKYPKKFAAIHRNIDRASKIARELLFFSQGNEVEFVPTELNELIHSSLTLLGPRQRDFDFDLDLADVPVIPAVPWKLEEVFLNLLINAMEAMPDGGKITIKTYIDDGAVIAEIIDTGIGIPPEKLSYIFDPFFTTKEVGKGTGLGLSICFGIMEAHSGRIEVDSNVGKGTRISLLFPLEVV